MRRRFAARAFAPEELARAAWLYHAEDLTQARIARALGTSRIRVIAMLAAARECGIVRVRIDAKTERQAALERALVSRFALSEAVVAPAAADEANTAVVVGQAAGTWLADQLRDGLAIGIGWGATLDAAVRTMDAAPRARIAVVSLLGGVAHSRTVMPMTVARRLSDLCSADCYQLTAPLVVATPKVARDLMAEPGLRALRERARQADLVIASVGGVGVDATLVRERIVSRADLPGLKRAGAVGDLLCRFLDAQGRAVDHPLNRRMVAVSLADVRRVPRIAIASGGRRKVAALRAALAAVPVSVLVTDEAAARGLLDGR